MSNVLIALINANSHQARSKTVTDLIANAKRTSGGNNAIFDADALMPYVHNSVTSLYKELSPHQIEKLISDLYLSAKLLEEQRRTILDANEDNHLGQLQYWHQTIASIIIQMKALKAAGLKDVHELNNIIKIIEKNNELNQGMLETEETDQYKQYDMFLRQFTDEAEETMAERLAAIKHDYEYYANILRKMKVSLQNGIDQIQEKIDSLDPHKEENQAKIKLLQDAKGSSQTGSEPSSSSLGGLSKQVDDTLSKAASDPEILTAVVVKKLSVSIKDVTENKIIQPMKKYQQEKPFLARMKEWLSNSLKNIFGFGMVSTAQTLFNVGKTEKVIAEIAEKKASAAEKKPR